MSIINSSSADKFRSNFGMHPLDWAGIYAQTGGLLANIAGLERLPKVVPIPKKAVTLTKEGSPAAAAQPAVPKLDDIRHNY